MQRLIILGILKNSPRHGYEIKKIIKKDLAVFTSLENKSIYYPLKIMAREGLIKKTTAKDKGRLPRYVYSITPHGNKEFLRLALEALLSEKRPFIDIDIPLYFLPFLDTKEVMARLRLRKRFLEKVKQWLSENIAIEEEFPVHQRLLLKHHLNLLSAEETFVDEIIGIVKDY
ncbi:MAG: PadR family transcriptional regulator [Candidatus Omnitrophica bacterium]|nr:PadR family transcriptional regulator [Candidatus Omnitrophota bacterium]